MINIGVHEFSRIRLVKTSTNRLNTNFSIKYCFILRSNTISETIHKIYTTGSRARFARARGGMWFIFRAKPEK
ncbi:MAG: hypothetical protein U5L45_02155 [Saprospiraceae bacterium]|nr:hypothetical protein [Saprospiraceae bacterium]